MALTQVSSKGIKDATLLNEDVNASANIAGSKLADNSISLAKLLHGDSNNNGKFLRANNGADPTFETVSTDLVADTSPQLGGNLDAGSHSIIFDDNSKVKLGNNNDLEVYHNGSSSVIQHTNTTSGNNLLIESDTKVIFRKITGSEKLAQFNVDGAVELYYDNTKKFETTSAGATTSGVSTTTDGNGSVNVGGNYLLLERTSGTTNYIAAPNADAVLDISADETIRFGTVNTGDFNSTERMRIDSSGRVGIRNTSMSSFNSGGDDLLIGNGTDGQDAGITLLSHSSDNCSIFFNDTSDTGITGLIQYRHDVDALRIFTATAERMRIDSSGNVLVGTTSDLGRLTVSKVQNDLSSAGSFANPHIRLDASNTTNNTGYTGIAYSVSSLSNYGWTVGAQRATTSGTDGVFTFRHHSNSATGTERMRIDHEGMTKVCSTSHAVGVSTTASSGTSKYCFRGHHSGTNGSPASGTLSFTVWSNGNVENLNNSYGQTSDETLKQDIVDASSQWDDIKNITVRKFRFKDNPTGELQIGVVAQEVEKVSPGLVYETGEVGEEVKAVKYSILYMKAIKALQEAITKIETLETKVAALEAA